MCTKEKTCRVPVLAHAIVTRLGFPHRPVGFTGGQIHLIDPVHKELSRLYNEERLLDKTKVRKQLQRLVTSLVSVLCD
jgi:hypothetical protein